MSAINHDAICALENRSMYARAGVRKAAKTRYVRADRKRGKAEIAQEVAALPQVLDIPVRASVWDASPADLEAMADDILARADFGCEMDELAKFERELESARLLEQVTEESSRIPLHLQGSLPDWMLERLEEANGSSFEELSLFEAKSPSPKAAISMDDEALYA